MSSKEAGRLTAASIVWDTEERNDLLAKEGHLRDTTMYLGAPLVDWMEKELGGVLAFLRTSTNVETSEVLVAKAQEGEPGAVQVRRLGAQNVVAFSFWRPLRKLNIKVPEDRQFNFTPRLLQMDGDLKVFVFAMNERVSVRRNIGEEAEFEAAAAAEPEA